MASTLGKWEQKQKCCVIQLKEILFIFSFIHQFVFHLLFLVLMSV